MEFYRNLPALRKENNLSQEELAEKLGVSRQAVAKWESGTNLPDITNLISISNIFSVSLDRLIRPETDFCQQAKKYVPYEEESIKGFLYEAKKNTYAANAPLDKESCRPNSHDLTYKKGNYLYIDTYLGGESFSGEEALWIEENPVWAMNYRGRTLNDMFRGDVLKAALTAGCSEMLPRGPLLFRFNQYTYHCKYIGEFDWFTGHEEIFYEGIKVFECYFNGGMII
ncbi:MAG: helix-turn-helix transcriptional regulator [Clostridia bacterium]|nr:helix-turn-helix transcriptional regulator [Clostridia bacterium]